MGKNWKDIPEAPAKGGLQFLAFLNEDEHQPHTLTNGEWRE
ncbi:MAG: hypothetical protein AAGD25_04650 [Cyanobacteria bacterium P01_F01_bin.150]